MASDKNGGRSLRPLVVAIVVLAIAPAAWLGWSLRSTPQKLLAPAVRALDEGDYDLLRLKRSALEGAAGLQRHRDLIDAALLVERGELAQAEQQLAAVSEAPDPPLPWLTALTRGRLAQARGEWESAQVFYQQALDANSESVGARRGIRAVGEILAPLEAVGRALAALEADEEQKLKAELETISADAKLEPFARLVRGAILMRDGRHDLALNEFGYSVRHPMLRGKTMALTGESLYRLGRFGDAQNMLLRAVVEDDSNVDAHRWLAVWYFDQGANDHAEMHLKKVSELDPRDGRPERLLGRMRFDFENYELAVKHLKRALQRNLAPVVQSEVRLELAQSYVKLREYAQAKQMLDEAGLMDGDAPPRLRASAFTTLAECELSLQGPQAAEAPLNEALRLDPDRLEAILLLGAIAEADGRRQDAVQAYRRAVRAAPRDYTANFRLAQALQRSGARDEAREALAVADQLKAIRTEFSELHQTAAERPTDVGVRLRLGDLAQQLDLPIAAGSWYKAVLALDPDNQQAMDALDHLREQAEASREAASPTGVSEESSS